MKTREELDAAVKEKLGFVVTDEIVARKEEKLRNQGLSAAAIEFLTDNMGQDVEDFKAAFEAATLTPGDIAQIAVEITATAMRAGPDNGGLVGLAYLRAIKQVLDAR